MPRLCHVFSKKSLDIVPVIVDYHKGTMILRIEKPESCPETAACQTTGDRFMLANLHILPPRATYATFSPKVVFSKKSDIDLFTVDYHKVL